MLQCYTFNNPDNVEDIKKTLKGGVDNGLELLLDIQQAEYMPMWKESGIKGQMRSKCYAKKFQMKFLTRPV